MCTGSLLLAAAGVLDGVDAMALLLTARIAGEDVAKAVQLGIEYDPPPFNAGSPCTAPPQTVALVRQVARAEAAAR